MKYVAGEYLNNLELGNTTAYASSPAADALFPITRLYDGYNSRIFQFGSLTADPYITIDLDRLSGKGDMETVGSPIGGWTTGVGAGTVTRTTVAGEFNGGTAGMKIAGVKEAYKDFVARSNERLNLRWYGKAHASGPVRVQIYNVFTGKWFNGTTWQTARVDAQTEAGTSAFTLKNLAFQIENWVTCQRSEVTIRLYILCTDAAATVFADDVSVYPTVNSVSIHGHNIAALNVVEFLSSDDNSSYSVAETMTQKQPTFYVDVNPTVAKRYVRVKFTGTNTAAIFISELVVCFVETIAEEQDRPFEIRYAESQVRNVADSGEVSASPLSDKEARVLKLDFEQTSETSHNELKNDIMRRCRGGMFNVLIIPVDNEEAIILGTVDNSWEVRRRFVTRWKEESLGIAERPFCTIVDADDMPSPHVDVPHTDTHTDVAHGDTHSDAAHSDVAHSDTHSDTAHSDTHSDTHDDSAHTDTAHDDFHIDGPAHSDSHGDVAHGDSHCDTPHYDDHGDHFDGGYTDFHGDEFCNDHTDSHDDSHSDVAHGDSHSDIAHGDSHGDAHTDTHTDVAHTDTHGDSHTDVAHGDTHTDSAHNDAHTDIPHEDA